MIYMQAEYEQILEKFVEAYLQYEEVMELTDITDNQSIEIVNRFCAISDEYCAFIAETYGDESPQLPNMFAYYGKDGYRDFAYRVYSAVLEAKQLPPAQEWRIFTLVYIGKLLKGRYKRDTI